MAMNKEAGTIWVCGVCHTMDQSFLMVREYSGVYFGSTFKIDRAKLNPEDWAIVNHKTSWEPEEIARTPAEALDAALSRAEQEREELRKKLRLAELTIDTANAMFTQDLNNPKNHEFVLASHG